MESLNTKNLTYTHNMKSTLPKILVGTPHADIKNYCLLNYVNSVKNLTYPNYNILVVDNSEGNKNKKKLVQLDLPTIHIKRDNKNTRRLLAESMEVLRQATLNGGYDYLLSYESDVKPPNNVIEQLLTHDKQVVSACYFIEHGKNAHLMVQEIEPHQIEIHSAINITNGANIKYADGKLHKVYAAGLGMNLIHRSVLEQIQFRYVEGYDAHPDSFFAMDLNYVGVPQYLDGGILCEHDNRSWATIKNK